MIAFLVGAGVMALGGIAEIFLGVRAEQAPLEDVAKPLTAEEAEDGGTAERHRAREARRSQGLHGRRRYRPGPGSTFYSPGMIGTAYSGRARSDEGALDREVDAIVSALENDGPADRRKLAQLVHARFWGPGQFSQALDEAVAEGRVRRTGRSRYEAVGRPAERKTESVRS